MKTVLLAVLLSFATCAADGPGAGPRWEREKVKRIKSPKGEVLWIAPVHEGWKVAAITLLNGGKGVEVFVDPERTYQTATDCGPFINKAVRVCTTWIEIFAVLPPKGAQESPGWRYPAARHSYPLQVWPGAQGVPFKLPNPKSGIDSEIRIFEANGSSWLVVITVFELVYDLDAMPIEAHGEGGESK